MDFTASHTFPHFNLIAVNLIAVNLIAVNLRAVNLIAVNLIVVNNFYMHGLGRGRSNELLVFKENQKLNYITKIYLNEKPLKNG